MQPPKKDAIDVIKSILENCLIVYPNSTFVKSLYAQYCERGSLSKKQLQGLHSKAAKVGNVSNAHLATLEAVILKKHSFHRSTPTAGPAPNLPNPAVALMEAILQKYPQHKRILFLQARLLNNEALSAADQTEIQRLHKLLCTQ